MFFDGSNIISLASIFTAKLEQILVPVSEKTLKVSFGLFNLCRDYGGHKLIIELSDFLITLALEIGWLRIQYYAVNRSYHDLVFNILKITALLEN